MINGGAEMGRYQKVVIFIIAFAVIAIGMWFYSIFYGTPWQKYKVKKEAEEYLKHKYTQKMNIIKSSFDCKEGDYVFIAQPESNKNLTFSVRQIKKTPFFIDRYFLSTWENEIEAEINPVIENLYSGKDTGVASISRDPISNDFEWNISKVPSYRETKSKITELDIIISVEKPFNNNKSQEEYEKMFNIIEFVKKQEYNPNALWFHYNTRNEVDKWSAFAIEREELPNIKTKDNIKKFRVR